MTEATTSEVAAGKSLFPRDHRHRYTAVCDLKTRLARLWSGHCQPAHDNIVLADVQSRTAADVVDPDELAIGESSRDVAKQLVHAHVVACRVVNVLIVQHGHQHHWPAAQRYVQSLVIIKKFKRTYWHHTY